MSRTITEEDLRNILNEVLPSKDLFEDAYITREYTLGTSSSWYSIDTINIAVDGYIPISVTARSNQAQVHYFNLTFSDTVLSVGRATNSTSTTLSANSSVFVVRYIKASLLGLIGA